MHPREVSNSELLQSPLYESTIINLHCAIISGWFELAIVHLTVLNIQYNFFEQCKKDTTVYGDRQNLYRIQDEVHRNEEEFEEKFESGGATLRSAG